MTIIGHRCVKSFEYSDENERQNTTLNGTCSSVLGVNSYFLCVPMLTTKRDLRLMRVVVITTKLRDV